MTFHGRVAAHAMQSATSSALSGPGTPAYTASAFAWSPPNSRLLSGADVHGFGPPAHGVSRLARALAREERAYGTIYLPELDALMHGEGPEAAGVARVIEATLTAIASAPWSTPFTQAFSQQPRCASAT